MSKFVHNMADALEALQEQVEHLQKKADTVIEPYKKFKEYPSLKGYRLSTKQHSGFNGHADLRDEYFYNTSNYGWYDWDKITQETINGVLAVFDEGVEKWKEDAKAIRQENDDIREHNNLQQDRVRTVMETLGIRGNYSTFEYKTSRSRNKTEMKKTAGWVQDLNRVIPKDDQYDSTIKRLESKRRSVEAFGKQKLEEAIAKRKEQEQKEKEQKAIRDLAVLQVKYGTNSDADAEDILDIILGKNKYLRLAHYLELNRGSWLDGYNYAEIGVDGFTEESDIDRDIVADITSYFEDFSDGRVFRDCEYNYGVLFGMVQDEDLYQDYEKVKSMVSLY